MGSGKGRARRVQAMLATASESPAQPDERAARFAAYKEVKAIIDDIGSSKLSEDETSTILWGAEGLLLASSADDPDVSESRTAFSDLMDGLEGHRWAEMLGTEDHPGTARRLRAAFDECAPPQ